MTNNQRNRLRMFLAVAVVLKKYSAEIATKAPLKAAADLFLTLLEPLNRLVGEKEKDLSGYTTQKEQLKEKMARTASSLAKAARVYARDRQDKSLEVLLSYSQWDILHSNDGVAAEICTDLSEELKKHVPALDEVLVTQADLEAFDLMIEKFSSATESKSGVYTSSTVGTREMGKQFTETANLLRFKLDGLIGRIEEELPGLYAEYFQSRKISDLGHRGAEEEEEETKA